MSYRGGRSKSNSALSILIGLACRHYGLTVPEMMREAKVSRRVVFSRIRILEGLGVRIVRHREAVRGSWRTIYRLEGIKGLRFKIERSC